ncbi:MAG TPA: glycosyltransferase [Tepidisphaeraceae bacterium]|nr:glycosyltransferase [Tepidisphaeraceae bacterium]
MTLAAPPQVDSAAEAYRADRVAHWDGVARQTEHRPTLARYYHRRLAEVYRFVVPPGQRVLELGCGRGDLLAALRPAVGVGIDLAPEMIRQGRHRHPHLDLSVGDALDAAVDGTFDFIVLSDLVNDLWDVQQVFQQLRPMCRPGTRLVMNFYSRLWEWPLAAAHRLGVAHPLLRQNWLTVPDVSNLLYLSGFEAMRHWEEILWPVRTPGVDALFNKFLVKLWPLKHGALTNFLLARPAPEPRADPPRVSVIVPARNEAGNVEAIFRRTPDMGSGTEIVFVEGGSRDDTYATIERAIPDHPERPARLLRQAGTGKGDAVRAGFAAASGEVLMILDADLTVPPEDLPRFYDALVSGKGEFVNGVRLVYPMEKHAMRLINLAGNKFFSLAFSWMLGQSVKDTLCGTKVLYKRDYERIAANRSYFGDFDPFGDFDLIFGASKLNQKIVDLPVRYRERTYGTTNINRWSHGWLLLKMVAFAARKLKFV